MYEGNRETSSLCSGGVSVAIELQTRIGSISLDFQVFDVQMLVEELTLDVLRQTVGRILLSFDLAVLQDLLDCLRLQPQAF